MRMWLAGLGSMVFFGLICLGCQTKVNTSTFEAVESLREFNELPDPFLGGDDRRIEMPGQWAEQRTYLKQMLAHYLYGQMPPAPSSFDLAPISSNIEFDGSVLQEQFEIILHRNGKSAKFTVGVRRPTVVGKYPVIIKNDGFLFDVTDVEDPMTREKLLKLDRQQIEQFVLQEAVKRGYVICKFIRDEVAPDDSTSRDKGVIALYPEFDWGTIAAWAWAYQILIDYFQTQEYADPLKIIATGHSRGGKAALCAGVYDDRIAVTAPSSSGAGGTASYRYFAPDQRQQLVHDHLKQFPHWWSPRYYDFSHREQTMPFDAHFQKAIIAPRGLINVHSRDDHWANPYGTYLTYLAAERVYKWLGADRNQGIHWRNGKHNQDKEDWFAIFEFCDQYFFNKKSELDFTQNPRPHQYNFEGIITFSAPE